MKVASSLWLRLPITGIGISVEGFLLVACRVWPQNCSIWTPPWDALYTHSFWQIQVRFYACWRWLSKLDSSGSVSVYHVEMLLRDTTPHEAPQFWDVDWCAISNIHYLSVVLYQFYGYLTPFGHKGVNSLLANVTYTVSPKVVDSLLCERTRRCWRNSQPWYKVTQRWNTTISIKDPAAGRLLRYSTPVELLLPKYHDCCPCKNRHHWHRYFCLPSLEGFPCHWKQVRNRCLLQPFPWKGWKVRKGGKCAICWKTSEPVLLEADSIWCRLASLLVRCTLIRRKSSKILKLKPLMSCCPCSITWRYVIFSESLSSTGGHLSDIIVYRENSL